MTTKPKRKAKPKARKTTKPATPKVKKPKGRPSVYSKALALRICERLATGKTLRAVCRADDMPTETCVRTWALDDREGFFSQYSRARELGYLSMADELTEISDDDSGDIKIDGDGNERMDAEFVGRSRLKLDTRKWLLSKALPKLYGDKLAVTGADGGAVKSENTVTFIELVAQPFPPDFEASMEVPADEAPVDDAT
jgi:hypothetical protein